MNISELEAFLQTLNLSEKHRNFKGFEVDLRGNLNPTSMLNEIFWTKKEWLNIEEFFERYVRMMYPDLKRMFAKEIGQLGAKFGSHLAARLYRTQVGFLTEYHCAALCQEIFKPEGFAVRRSPDLDRIGVDIQLVRQKESYNLHVFVDSPRAWLFRREKRLRKSSDQEQGTHIDFPYQVRSGCIHSLRLLSNNFGVYRREYIDHLKHKILSGDVLGVQVEKVDCKQGLIFIKQENLLS